MFHYSLAAGVLLRNVGGDVQSPSRFAKAAAKVKGVEAAFRTLGRFDAVVFVHAEGDDEVHEAALALLRIKNVERIEFFVGLPGDED